MPQNATVAVPARTWTQITNADVTSITFQVGSYAAVKATVGAVAPTSFEGSLEYPAGSGESNAALAELFSGVSGANRVYVYSHFATGVTVSHA